MGKMKKALIIMGLTALAPTAVLAQTQSNQFKLETQAKPSPISATIEQKDIQQMFLILVDQSKSKAKTKCPYDVGFRVSASKASSLTNLKGKTLIQVSYNGKNIISKSAKIAENGNVFIPCLTNDTAQTIKKDFNLICKQNPALGIQVCALNPNK